MADNFRKNLLAYKLESETTLAQRVQRAAYWCAQAELTGKEAVHAVNMPERNDAWLAKVLSEASAYAEKAMLDINVLIAELKGAK
jgi:ribosomal protein L22